MCVNYVPIFCRINLGHFNRIDQRVYVDGPSVNIYNNLQWNVNAKRKKFHAIFIFHRIDAVLSQTNEIEIVLVGNNYDPCTKDANAQQYGTIILHELFLSALKGQNDKHTSAHPPLSTTVPLCGCYGKSNFTHHGLCILLSIFSTRFLWRHCDFINQ